MATRVRVLGLLARRLGPPPSSLPSAPECGGTASFRAARLPPDLSARVSWGPRASSSACGGCSLCLFCRPPLKTRRCLFLETLFSAIRGVPGARVTPGPHLPFPLPGLPLWAGGPGPPVLALGLRGARCPLPSRGPGLGQELAGWARAARKLESFVLAPRPARRGEEGRERRPRPGGLGRGRPWSQPRPRASSGFPA